MTVRKSPLASRLSRRAIQSFSKPRRRFLVSAAALAAGAAAWFGLSRPPVHSPAQILEALSDRLLPAAGENPGSLKLGVHERLVERHLRGDRFLTRLVQALTDRDFMSLDDRGKDELLNELLADTANGAVSRSVRYAIDVLVRDYYSRPEAWAAIGYRKPQPLGYSDYARCSGDTA